MMRNAGIFGAGLVTGVLIATSLPVPSQEHRPLPHESIAALRKITETWGAIKANYVVPVRDDTLAESCLAGMLRGLDSHSDYYDRADFAGLRSSPRDAAGIGLEVRASDGQIVVASVVEGGPAEEAGIRRGDLLISLDGNQVYGMRLKDVAVLMRGRAGSTVQVKLMRSGASVPSEFSVIRRATEVPAVRAQLVAGGVAYVRISSMREDTPQRFASMVEGLHGENGGPLKGLVLDLRDSPGGLLHASISIASAFLDDHVLIARTEGRTEHARKSFTANPRDATEAAKIYRNYPKELRAMPLVVIVNRGTASGSEIVAAALQDHGRAAIVGEKTLGMGTIQTIMPFNDGSAIKMTTANWQTPKGRAISNEGITPDAVLAGEPGPATAQSFGKSGDAGLARALEVLAARSAR